MKVCIIGWYGTETIGDRAILAGTLAFLSEMDSDLTVFLGSLHPFFSERTVAEDNDLWTELVGHSINVELFDSSMASALKHAIKASDLLLLGGGPLMDLREMHMLSFAFSYARRQKVRAGIFGCGVGPLKKPEFIKATIEIYANTDFAVFRDRLSETEARRLYPKKEFNAFSAVDPAAYCAMLFRQKVEAREKTERITINLRKISEEYKGEKGLGGFEKFAADMVEKILTENESRKVLLIPHHYFFFGGDDRTFLNTIKYRIGSRELLVQNEPLSLRETMHEFASSACCIGMRFHAILLMTLLSGRCRILNYTGKSNGKIRGFLNDFDSERFFDSSRMVSLESGELDLSIFDNMLTDARFEPPAELLDKAFQVYRSVLSDQLQ